MEKQQKFELTIHKTNKDGVTKIARGKILIEDTQLNDHEIAGCLFAMEFASNNNDFHPMRIWINNL